MESQTSIVNFDKYINIAKRRWSVGLGVFFPVFLVSVFAASLKKPDYEAQGKILFHKTNTISSITGVGKEIGNLEPIVQDMKTHPLNTEAEVIRSTPIVEQTINRLKLLDAEGIPLKIEEFMDRLTVKDIKGTDIIPSFLHGAFRLEVYFYLTFSVFLFQVLNYFRVGLPYKNFGLYLFSLALVLGYFLLKKFAYRLVGFITEGTAETNEYLFNMNNANRVMGLTLFPFILLIAFFPFEDTTVPLTLGIFAAAILYFLLLYRGFIILLKKQFSIFYLFLYFCTLEFLPLVLLYKIIVL